MSIQVLSKESIVEAIELIPDLDANSSTLLETEKVFDAQPILPGLIQHASDRQVDFLCCDSQEGSQGREESHLEEGYYRYSCSGCGLQASSQSYGRRSDGFDTHRWQVLP